MGKKKFITIILIFFLIDLCLLGSGFIANKNFTGSDVTVNYDEMSTDYYTYLQGTRDIDGYNFELSCRLNEKISKGSYTITLKYPQKQNVVMALVEANGKVLLGELLSSGVSTMQFNIKLNQDTDHIDVKLRYYDELPQDEMIEYVRLQQNKSAVKFIIYTLLFILILQGIIINNLLNGFSLKTASDRENSSCLPKWENAAMKFIKDNFLYIVIIAATLIGIIIRISLLDYISADMRNALVPWLQKFKENGGFKALAYGITNYNVSYELILAVLSYLPVSFHISIKLVSIIFEFFGIIMCSDIVAHFYSEDKKGRAWLISYIIFTAFPTAVLNGAMWGQCDFIYVAFILACIYALLKKRYTLSFVMFAVAFAFKLHAVMFLPVLMMFYFFNGRVSVTKFLYIPLTLLVFGIPAFIAGRSLQSIADIYISQTGAFPYLFMGYPNIYVWINSSYDLLAKGAVLFTVALLLILVTIMFVKKYKLTEENLVLISMVVSFTCVMFLPAMHERYGFLPEVLAVIYVLIKKKHFWLLYLEVSATITYFIYFFNTCPVSVATLSVFNFVAWVGTIILLCKSIFSQNKDQFAENAIL